MRVTADCMLMASLIRCAKAHEWQRALSLLNEMRTAGVAPDVITFNSALSALAKGGETSRMHADGPSNCVQLGALVACEAS